MVWVVGLVWWMLVCRWRVGVCLGIVRWWWVGIVGGWLVGWVLWWGVCRGGVWWLVGRGVGAGGGGAGGGVVFVFPGQGSQWVGMAVELLDCSPVFRERLGECGEALSGFVDWSVEGVLRGVGGAPGLDRVDVVQPVLWAVMVALAGLWEWCGVRPVGVVGHSQGEIAAACCGGWVVVGGWGACCCVAFAGVGWVGWWGWDVVCWVGC